MRFRKSNHFDLPSNSCIFVPRMQFLNCAKFPEFLVKIRSAIIIPLKVLGTNG